MYLLRQTFARHRKNPNNDPIPQEELNLEYVAVTRAKLEAVWVDEADDFSGLSRAEREAW